MLILQNLLDLELKTTDNHLTRMKIKSDKDFVSTYLVQRISICLVFFFLILNVSHLSRLCAWEVVCCTISMKRSQRNAIAIFLISLFSEALMIHAKSCMVYRKLLSNLILREKARQNSIKQKLEARSQYKIIKDTITHYCPTENYGSYKVTQFMNESWNYFRMKIQNSFRIR